MVKKVVFVDDSKTMLMLAKVAAKPLVDSNKVEIVQYDNPLKLIEDIENDGFTFDLLITDINMPQISGFELVEVIKNIDFLQDVIFMALTTEGAKDKEDLIRNAGFAGWIMKPFKTEVLKKAIEKILKL